MGKDIRGQLSEHRAEIYVDDVQGRAALEPGSLQVRVPFERAIVSGPLHQQHQRQVGPALAAPSPQMMPYIDCDHITHTRLPGCKDRDDCFPPLWYGNFSCNAGTSINAELRFIRHVPAIESLCRSRRECQPKSGVINVEGGYIIDDLVFVLVNRLTCLGDLLLSESLIYKVVQVYFSDCLEGLESFRAVEAVQQCCENFKMVQG